ncbi:hypothetical protein [Enterobacteria phage vB_EcoM_IME339]|uniref:Uncharacterized protein n=1 Tax=Enterobacteria phage vB_EcoM_IME339 TaxID=2163889 RepID=A0A2S1GQD5_9CAUD|nr:hypothetical protein KNT85_gp192 [Enterobacteria phage vB_EcoM_IME339]AWD91604.1 hypothetical protein [Enterobacteria phage vB_EcoM_IME339]
MNPESKLSQRIAEARRQFFENMIAQGIDDEVFLNWFWNHKYSKCAGAILISAAMMYEGWKGAKKIS